MVKADVFLQPSLQSPQNLHLEHYMKEKNELAGHFLLICSSSYYFCFHRLYFHCPVGGTTVSQRWNHDLKAGNAALLSLLKYKKTSRIQAISTFYCVTVSEIYPNKVRKMIKTFWFYIEGDFISSDVASLFSFFIN